MSGQDEKKAEAQGVTDAQRQCFDVLRAGLAGFEGDLDKPLPMAEEMAPPKRRERLGAYSDVVQHDVAKFVLFAANSTEAKAIVPVCETLLTKVQALTCFLRAVSSGGTGSTLGKAARALAQSVIRALRAVVDDMEQRLDRGLKPRLSYTGMLVESLDSLKKLPVTDSEAVGRALMRVMGVVKDARAELQGVEVCEDAGEAAAAGEAADAAAADFGDEDFFDDFGAAEPLTPEQFKLVAPCEEMAKVAYACMKHVAGTALKRKDTGDAEWAAWLEEQLSTAREASEAADEMVCCVAGPHDPEGIRAGGAALAAALRTMLGRSDESADREWVAPVREHLERAAARLQGAAE